jgi:hypothetical protein
LWGTASAVLESTQNLCGFSRCLVRNYAATQVLIDLRFSSLSTQNAHRLESLENSLIFDTPAAKAASIPAGFRHG